MLINRLINIDLGYSLFLFGARGTGKSTLITQLYDPAKVLTFNLLKPSEELQLLRNPELLRERVLACDESIQYVVIDEIQKVPKLLDVVQLLLESDRCEKYFILTGSSARQLKAAGVNLLAGRAFTYALFPFSFIELKELFDLEDALKFGTLPKIYAFSHAGQKTRFLRSYTLTYLKEEIWASRLVKNLEHFRRFLEVAAQMNGKIVNYSNISKDVGVDDKTVKTYFELLEDTLLGFFLEPFHHSFRKRLRSAPKFYFFDVGVARALAALLSVTPHPKTSYYGDLFEQYVITECFKLKEYFQPEFKLSYFQTTSDVEVDLIIERPGRCPVFVEINSSDLVQDSDLRSLNKISREFGNCEAVCLSQDPLKRIIEGVTVYPWQEGLRKLFEI